MLPYPSNRVIPADMPTIMAGITETHNKEQQVNYIFTFATPIRLLEMDGQIITGTFKHYT